MLQKLRECLAARRQVDLDQLAGVITFFGAHHALKGDAVLRNAGFTVVLIPGPRKISPNCGTALRFDYACINEIRTVLSDKSVSFEMIHHYPHHPELDK